MIALYDPADPDFAYIEGTVGLNTLVWGTRLGLGVMAVVAAMCIGGYLIAT